MQLLLITATSFEIRSVINQMIFVDRKSDFLERYRYNNHRIDLLIPGVGMTFTAYHLGKQLLLDKYDFAMNVGICGSFDPLLKIGEVVEITEESICELGAEDREQFLPMFNLGLMDPDAPPYLNGRLVNTCRIRSSTIDTFSKVTAVTVNRVHGNLDSIKKVKDMFSPQVESMEGAAFFYGCLLERVPCIQLRAVSNYVEERNRAKWNVELALKNINSAVMQILSENSIETSS